MPSAPANGSPAQPDVSIVVTAHHEGVLAHATFVSLAQACRAAGRHDLRVEVVVVLDRPDVATVDYVGSLADDQVFDPTTTLRIIKVDHGDLGLARNSGMRSARAELAGTLDADNLVSENWVVEAVRTAREHPDAVVHPEWTVGFGERRFLWPSIPTHDPRFRPELMRAHSYWDAFALARRQTYLDHPYAASGSGHGPEDWHWNLVTVAAGVQHVVAAGTAQFYRVKGAGSLMSQHQGAGHLVAPAALLVSPELARSVVERRSAPPEPLDPDELLDVVRRAVDAAPEPSVDVGTPLEGVDVDPAHYRVLHRDLRAMDNGELAQHWEGFGRAEGRRAILTDGELDDLARWRLEHYRLLNPDLAVLPDDELLDHFLDHGRREGRSGWLEPEELAALAGLRVPDYLTLNPDLHALTPEQAVVHFLRHGAGRPSRLPPRPPDVSSRVTEEWEAACRIEPLLPRPTEDVLASYEPWGHAPDSDPPPAVGVWWDAVHRLATQPGELGLLLVADRLDEHGLADHVVAAQEVTGPVRVLVTGEEDPQPEELPAGTTVVRLADVPGHGRMDASARARLVADLVVQLQPRVVHLWGRGAGFDALAWHGEAMARHSTVHVTVDGSGLSGPLHHPLLGRQAWLLDLVAQAWVDSSSTADRLWEVARLPRERFIERPAAGELRAALLRSPGYGPDHLPPEDTMHGSAATADLLRGADPVALVVTGYEGFANLGDILQAKNLSEQWRARGVTPVHLVSASALRTAADLEVCRHDADSPHVLVTGFPTGAPSSELDLVRIDDVRPGGLLHIGGGGYLNRHWHRQRMRGIASLVSVARPRAAVVSGVQIDDVVVDGLRAVLDSVPPVILGARDERSRVLLEQTSTAVPARSSFDDATEVIDAWVRAQGRDRCASGRRQQAPSPGRGTRIGLHLNTSDYAADASVLVVVDAALRRLRDQDPHARLTVLHAYDDDRPDVADSLESLPKLRAGFAFDRFDVVDLAQGARDLDLAASRVPSLGPLEELDLAIVASYHTALLLGLLGVPTHLLATNSFYDDKAAGLGQHATLEEFLADPVGRGISLDRARQVRETWLDDLAAALSASGAASPRTPDR